MVELALGRDLAIDLLAFGTATEAIDYITRSETLVDLALIDVLLPDETAWT